VFALSLDERAPAFYSLICHQIPSLVLVFWVIAIECLQVQVRLVDQDGNLVSRSVTLKLTLYKNVTTALLSAEGFESLIPQHVKYAVKTHLKFKGRDETYKYQKLKKTQTEYTDTCKLENGEGIAVLKLPASGTDTIRLHILDGTYFVNFSCDENDDAYNDLWQLSKSTFAYFIATTRQEEDNQRTKKGKPQECTEFETVEIPRMPQELDITEQLSSGQVHQIVSINAVSMQLFTAQAESQCVFDYLMVLLLCVYLL
jgi:hypothetical protein